MNIKDIVIEVDSLTLNAALYSPGKSGRYPAICICHGIPAGPYDPSDSHYPVVAEKFCRAGFAALIFNFRGAGYSGGNFQMSGWKRDLKAVVDILCNLEEIDSTRLAVIGFSAGAAVGICVAAEDSRIACVVAMACPADFSMMKREEVEESIARFREIGIIKEPDFPASVNAWYEDFGNVTAIRDVTAIAPRPLLLVHGRRDDVVPLDHAFRLSESAGESGTLYVLGEAGHRLSRHDEAVDIALQWIGRRLYIDPDSAKAV